MERTTRATLVFPRTGQIIKISVPVEKYDEVNRRTQEIIRIYSPKTRGYFPTDRDDTDKIASLSA